jgi:hypothetical protein
MTKTWAQMQAKRIMDDAEHDYGRGWNRLSDAQKQEYVQSRVLMLVLTQCEEAYKPAQDMARNVLTAVEALL